MERKIGEIFKLGGEWYQCIKNDSCRCDYCDFGELGNCHNIACTSGERKDGKEVAFKKLEKVGEPYIIGNKLIQRYKMYPTTYNINVHGWYYHNLDVKSWTIDLEIKQTKENMEEYRMYDAKEDIPEFDKVVDECLFCEDKLNLKPFNLQKAREGKPVCTRDGRKARILCFDLKNNVCPIVAAVEENNMEVLYQYDTKGLNFYKKSEIDLMMLPEKKEGWINVYKERIYSTKEEAIEATHDGVTYIDTVKISWEE